MCSFTRCVKQQVFSPVQKHICIQLVPEFCSRFDFRSMLMKTRNVNEHRIKGILASVTLHLLLHAPGPFCPAASGYEIISLCLIIFSETDTELCQCNQKGAKSHTVSFLYQLFEHIKLLVNEL